MAWYRQAGSRDPLPEPMLNKISDIIWYREVQMSQEQIFLRQLTSEQVKPSLQAKFNVTNTCS